MIRSELVSKALWSLTLVVLTFCVTGASSAIFKETFSTSIKDRWIFSTANPDYGKVSRRLGYAYGDKDINVGLKTLDDSHFYAFGSKLDTPFDNRDRTLVLSFTVKHEQNIECGGAYIKLLPDTDLSQFNGDSEYAIMFGPDICGLTKNIQLIFHRKGTNFLWKKKPRCPSDRLSHVYTLILPTDGTYSVAVDNEVIEEGLLNEDWAFLPDKTIVDPNDKKPDDWVDIPMIDDPSDKKPEDWDNIPPTIPDEDAKRPDDWDEEEDGVWEPPHRTNPEYRGVWTPRRISNPDYKGPWIPRRIANPDFKDDPTLYINPKPLSALGFDLWQVKAGTIFDNIILSDNVEEVRTYIAETWGATHEAEKEKLKERDLAQREKESARSDDYEATKKKYEDAVSEEL